MKDLILLVGAWVSFLCFIILQPFDSTCVRVLRIVLSGVIGGILGYLICCAWKAML